MFQETERPGGFSVERADVERSVLSAEAADNTVVSFNSNKSNLHSKSSIDLNNLINSPTNVRA